MWIKNILLNRNFYLMLLLDTILVTSAYILAHLLRFDGHISQAQWMTIKNVLPYLVPFKLLCFFLFGLYRGMWRYTSLVDLKNILKATGISSIFIILAIFYLFRLQGYPRSVYIVDWGLTFLLVSGSRVFVRMFLERPLRPFKILTHLENPSVKLLIIGAGDAGEKVVREILESPWSKFMPVGFLDDDTAKRGKSIHGVPVLGRIDQINRLRTGFDEILIAIPSIKGEQMRRIVDLCKETGKRFRTVPGIWELIEGKVSVKSVRDVNLEDLLGRQEVHLDKSEISRYLNNKRIMITGAGGSIGSELVRQVCRFNPQALALLDFSEYNLFRLEMECQQRFSSVSTSGFLTNIRNGNSVKKVFEKFRPDAVFHAAAYKHVPIQELHPWEAAYNNIIGTRNLVESAAENQVERFVLVSTDKAVRPTNVMGATKRVAEMLVQSMNGNGTTRFMAVRFGNVIGSSGSAIPLFQEQISQGRPVTVTHPEITRYFMSIPEAAQLILQAGAMGKGGEIFILDMGNPIRILDMVRELIRLNGFEPERDIPIQFIGLRPGEKLYEELIAREEGVVPTNHKNILVLRGKKLNYNTLNADIDRLMAIADTYDATSIKKKLRDIVPEYTPLLFNHEDTST